MSSSTRRLIVITLCLALLAVAATTAVALVAENYQLAAKWGSNGTGNSQFRYAKNVAVDPTTGDVYVADADIHRIQKFDSSGSYLTKWGSYGTGTGQFKWPAALTVDSTGNVYVADSDNNRVQKFSSTGTYITQWGVSGSGNGQFQGPFGIAVDSSDTVYVTDKANHRVQTFSSTGTYVTQWGGFGNQNSEFKFPEGVAADSAGNVFVVDTINNRIQKFNSIGTYLTQWGGSGGGDGNFNEPDGIAVDSTNNVYVADRQNNRIQKFSSSGAFIAKWGSLGSGDGYFKYPRGVAVDSAVNAYVYVADTQNDRIQKFNLDYLVPPITTLTLFPPAGRNGWNKAAKPLIYLARSEPGVTYYKWNAGSWQTYTGSFLAPEGVKTLYYRSVDNDDNAETVRSRSIKVDSFKPTTKVRTPRFSSSQSRTRIFIVRWSPSDASPSSGIAHYYVQYKIGKKGSWRNWKSQTTARSARLKIYPGRTYYIRARTRDKAGNLGRWSAVRKTIAPYDNGRLIRRRVGFGRTYKNSKSRFYLGTVRYSTRAGEAIVYRFTSNHVALISTRSRTRSKARIYINGRYIKTINPYSWKSKFRQVVFKKTWKSRRTRTIKIVNVGNRRRFDVDGLAVGK